jgi:hypothetical protein
MKRPRPFAGRLVVGEELACDGVRRRLLHPDGIVAFARRFDDRCGVLWVEDPEQ